MAVTKDGIYEAVNTLSKLVGDVAFSTGDNKHLAQEGLKATEQVASTLQGIENTVGETHAKLGDVDSDVTALKHVVKKLAADNESTLQTIASTMFLLVQQVKKLNDTPPLIQVPAPVMAPPFDGASYDYHNPYPLTETEKLICVGLKHSGSEHSVPQANGCAQNPQVIDAVIALRKRTNLGLKEAKDSMDSWRGSMEGGVYRLAALQKGVVFASGHSAKEMWMIL